MRPPRCVPPEAEELDLMAHVRMRRKPSRFAPGAEQLFFELLCPACDAVEPLPKIDELSICNCGLHRSVGALRLYIWRTAKVIHVNVA